MPRLADCHRRFGFSPTPEHVYALESNQRRRHGFIPCPCMNRPTSCDGDRDHAPPSRGRARQQPSAVASSSDQVGRRGPRRGRPRRLVSFDAPETTQKRTRRAAQHVKPGPVARCVQGDAVARPVGPEEDGRHVADDASSARAAKSCGRRGSRRCRRGSARRRIGEPRPNTAISMPACISRTGACCARATAPPSWRGRRRRRARGTAARLRHMPRRTAAGSRWRTADARRARVAGAVQLHDTCRDGLGTRCRLIASWSSSPTRRPRSCSGRRSCRAAVRRSDGDALEPVDVARVVGHGNDVRGHAEPIAQIAASRCRGMSRGERDVDVDDARLRARELSSRETVEREVPSSRAIASIVRSCT